LHGYAEHGVAQFQTLGSYMRYFTYLAEASFKTSEKGERLFYRSGPWSRPYIVPDLATEQRLYRKQVWILRILLGGLIIGQPFLFAIHPEVTHEPIWFFSYLLIILFIFWIIGKFVFASDLRSLHRMDVRLPFQSFYAQNAERHSKSGLVFGLLGSLLFVALGIFFLFTGTNRMIGIVTIGFFGICAVAWGYALFVKIMRKKSPTISDEIHRT
jgi:hypothetical protein